MKTTAIIRSVTTCIQSTFLLFIECTICVLLLSADNVRAGADNEFIDELHILPKLIESADRSGDPLHTKVFRDNVGGKCHWFLSAAHFVGQYHAPYGRVYVAQFVFTESGERNDRWHSRHSGYLCFFDAKFRMRVYWKIDQPSPLLYNEESAIMMENEQRTSEKVLDFADLPTLSTIAFGGRDVPVPRW